MGSRADASAVQAPDVTVMENLAEASLVAEQEDDVFLIVTLAGQACGLPVMLVRHLLGPQVITPIPLAPSGVVGGFNLGGCIVTAIDLRRRLSLPIADDASIINVIVEYAGALYSLIVDQVQEVQPLQVSKTYPIPPRLDPLWQDLARNIHRSDDQMIVMLDVERLLCIG